jgi:hypothetical protein
MRHLALVVLLLLAGPSFAQVTLGNANPNALTITTPPHAAGPVDIVVFPSGHPNGFSGYTLTNAFTYVDSVPALTAKELAALGLLLTLIGMFAMRKI